MKQRKQWAIEEFNKVNLPEVIEIGDLLNKNEFSQHNDIRVLDLPIYMPGKGWMIPDILEQFQPVIDAVTHNELQYGTLSDHYVYITVDQKLVKAGNTGRRSGAHSDAYMIDDSEQQIDIGGDNSEIIKQELGEVSHTYIITDAIPTEFFEAKFPLTDTSCEGSIKCFNTIANDSEVVYYPLYTLLKLDPFVVHRSGITDKDCYRTFVKISVSKKKYSRKGNTVNPGFEYKWDFKERNSKKRNHPW